MAEKGRHNDLEHILNLLSLQEYYPSKLTSQNIIEITGLSLSEDSNITTDTISWHFINRLARNNYNARAVKITESSQADDVAVGYLQRRRRQKSEEAGNLHPLDVLVAVFYCCDPVAKQDLVKYLWNCKLAVPFILYSQLQSKCLINIWPLRGLISQWQGQNDKSSTEHPIVSYKMPIVAFIRYGKCNDSKSALINNVIGGAEKAHPIFFHRDMYGSKKDRSPIVDGMVELAWYLLKGDKTDIFDRCLTFANLRGDASIHPKQVDILCKIADILVIMTTSDMIKDLITMVGENLQRSLRTIILLSDSSIEEKEVNNIDSFLSACSVFKDLEEGIEILTPERQRLAEKTESLSRQIKQMLKGNARSLAKSISTNMQFLTARGHDVDEHLNISLKDGIRRSLRVVDPIYTFEQEERKQKSFPLQGDLLVEWVRLENESLRQEQYSKKEHGGSAKNLQFREKSKAKVRKEQHMIINNLPRTISIFIYYLKALNSDKLDVFLRSLKLTLDQRTRQTLVPFYETYQSIVNEKTGANKEANVELNRKIQQHEKQKSNLSVGLEHLCREMGQLYETCYCIDGPGQEIKLDRDVKIKCSLLPFLAAKILLMGYPLEVMNGDVGFVPEKWVSAVLRATEATLKKGNKNTRIHIISVLGIQSSGKSTFLNTMFGPQFAVSAGRCTVGVFMQMIPIHEKLQSELHGDYLVLIDTEGLRSSKIDVVKFDNELSCFTIGLSDMTLVNLMGENATYLQENLPVVVHAFLRMDMVGLRPRCTIIHQNVDKKNKKKLTEQGQTLERILDELTDRACGIENIKPSKYFNEIIEFNIADCTDHIPSLFEGEQPMAPISQGYSQECDFVRRKMINQIKKHSRRITIGELQVNLKRLWEAIKMDDFVFAFKSIHEAEARVQLDHFYCETSREFLIRIDEISKQTIDLMAESNDSRTIEIFEEKYNSVCNILKIDTEKKINEYIHKTPMISRLKWNDEVCERFKKEFEVARVDGLETVRQQLEENTQTTLYHSINECQMEEMQRIIEQNHGMPKSALWRMARQNCLEGMNKQLKNAEDISPKIEIDVLEIVNSIFSQWKNLIKKALDKYKTLRHYNFCTMPCTEHDLEHKYSSTVKKVMETFFPTRRSKGETYREFMTTIFEQTNTYLQDIRRKNKTYKQSSVRTLFLDVKKYIEENETGFHKEFVVDCILSVSGEVVTQLSDLYSKEKQMDQYKNYLDNNQEKMITLLVKGVDPKVDIELQEIILSISGVARTRCFNVSMLRLINTMSYTFVENKIKSQIFTEMLSTLVSENNTDLMKEYCNFPSSSLSKYLKRYCINVRAMKSLSRRILRETKAVILRTLKELPSGSTAGLFVRKLRSMRIDVEEENVHQKLSLLGKHRDVGYLIDAVCCQISGIRELDFDEWIDTNNKTVNAKICQAIVQDCIGCTECCPFCNEICKFRDKKHRGQHESLMHRPIAAKGYHDERTKQLAVGTCEMFVASNWLVKVDGEYIPFKDYLSAHSEWKIRKDINAESSTYWKWYLVKKPDNILASYPTLQLDVPESWKNITVEHVLDSLAEINRQYKYISKT